MTDWMTDCMYVISHVLSLYALSLTTRNRSEIQISECGVQNDRAVQAI